MTQAQDKSKWLPLVAVTSILVLALALVLLPLWLAMRTPTAEIRTGQWGVLILPPGARSSGYGNGLIRYRVDVAPLLQIKTQTRLLNLVALNRYETPAKGTRISDIIFVRRGALYKRWGLPK